MNQQKRVLLNKIKRIKSFVTLNFLRLSAIVFFIIIFAYSCFSPPIFHSKINDANNVDLKENEFSLINYNIQSAFGKSDKKISSLSNYFNKHKYDFVVMQEVFDEDVRTQLLQNFDTSFYKAKIPRVDYNNFPSNLNQDAGLFSISRFPLVDLSHINFGDDVKITNGGIHQMLQKSFSISLDFLANKSILGSLHQINDSTNLFLFSTHLQAISSRFHKTFQLEQIYRFIVNAVYTVVKKGVVKSPNKLVVLLVGDLNYDAYSENDVNTLKSYLGNPRDLHKEYNNQLEEFTLFIKWIGLYRRVDYIFAYDNIGLIKLGKVKTKSINVSDITDEENGSISDHLALKATLVIE